MAQINDVPQVQLIVGMLYSDPRFLNPSLKKLVRKFGMPRDMVEYDFDHYNEYYVNEMGKSLKKRLLIFNKRINRHKLAKIKHLTNKLENKFSENGKRNINIDPGYLTGHNVVLATCKEMPHRVYLSDGIFADVVLEYRNGNFEENHNNFPDLSSLQVKDFLKRNRL